VSRITIYPAYSAAPGEIVPVIWDAPEACTALRIKRAVGHEATSWLYVRLPAHPYAERCRCYSCIHDKAGWWKRAGWGKDFGPQFHRWVRTDIGASNVRLTFKGGEHCVVVALVDMPQFAAELASHGRHGMLIALDWATRRAA
jgi:hypothetical protein